MEAFNRASELGEAHFERREIPEALECFIQAVECGGDPGTHSFERWASWMLLGDFERAWRESDKAGSSIRGQLPIEGGRVLIRCLRGLGDAIQFLRYARELRHRSDHIAVHVPPRLLPLCPLIPGIDHAISFDHALADNDYDCEMECSDLPYLFRTTEASIPCATGYLRLPAGRVPLGSELTSANGDYLKAGIVWAAASWNPERSIPLALLRPLTVTPGLKLFSLQRGPEADELHGFRPGGAIVNAEREAGDILDTMDVISQLDLVITVDTMIAHLAGAMGKRVWTLLTYAADWRWMLGRSDSPWYKSMRLFRQLHPGDWASVVDQVTNMLVADAALCRRSG
jgi:hypothetical protein